MMWGNGQNNLLMLNSKVSNQRQSNATRKQNEDFHPHKCF